MGQQQKKRRWWPRFGLRTFLISFTVVSLWFGWRISVVRRIDGAVQRLEQSGCMLTYPIEFTEPEPVEVPVTLSDGSETNLTLLLHGGQVVHQYGPDRSYATRFLLGYREWDLPECVSVGAYLDKDCGTEQRTPGDALVAELLPWINRLPSISDLDLSETRVTGDCCHSLAAIPSLRWVLFEYTDVGDDDIEEFALLTQLDHLNLYNTKWTDAGVANLKRRLPNCDIKHESSRFGE